MVRRDLSQDVADRPHYYSQFWVDVASGKRDVASSSPEEAVGALGEEADEFAEDYVEPAPVAPPKPKAPRPEPKRTEQRPTITSLADLANIDLLMKNSAEMQGDEVPDLETGPMDDLESFQTDALPDDEENVDAADDIDENEPEYAESESDEFDDFDLDVEEDEWGNTRKSSKPSKPRRRERDRHTNF